ncbi:MAG: hypothetical protein H6Q67_1346 [Firmicutes bacterium]|nr:hypothetical protein [Bacillota bacterium]
MEESTGARYYTEKENCIINIFCGDENKHDFDHEKHDDDHCIINIFCGEDDEHHEHHHDHDHEIKHDGKCIINIFCGHKKKDCKDENW